MRRYWRRIYPYAYENPGESIPLILAGDLIGERKTGTGKTLAFLLPVFNLIDNGNRHTQALVIVPTRELADRITEVCRILEPFDIGVVSVLGDCNIESQISGLKQSSDSGWNSRQDTGSLRRGTINFKYLKHGYRRDGSDACVQFHMEDLLSS